MGQPLPGYSRRPDAELDRPPVELPVQRRPAHGLLPALAAAVIIIGSGVGGLVLLMGPGVPTVVARGPAPAGPTSSPGADAEPTTLPEQAAADEAAARQLVGHWLPQLSAAAPGPADDEARIWSDYRALRAEYPDVVLVRSGDYRSYAKPGHWVVLLARAFPTAAAANAWCEDQRRAPDECFAKRLSHTGGPAANTVFRG